MGHEEDRAEIARLQSRLAELERTQATQLHAVLESAPDAVVVVNAQGQMVQVNAQTEHCFGYRRHELYGKPVEMLMPTRYRDAHPEHRARFYATPPDAHDGSGTRPVWIARGWARVSGGHQPELAGHSGGHARHLCHP